MALVDVHAKVSVELFPDRIDQLTNTPTGPVGQMVEHTAQVLLIGSRARIGDRYSGHHGGPLMKDTGQIVNIGGSAYAVVFTHDKAFLHHEGKRSGYTITPKNEKNWLGNPRNPARTSGGPFFAKGSVTWTGNTSGNPFLTDAATDLGLRPSGALLRGKRPTRLFRLRQP